MGSATSSPQAQQCPMQKQDTLSPNNIPSDLSNVQKSILSIERELSSIPRSTSYTEAEAPSLCPVIHDSDTGAKGKEKERWVYPSPQQFQNALARKGKEAPKESVSMMVQIHNWLNERAWQEIVRLEDFRNSEESREIELARFSGRPNDLSPKARYHMLLAKFFPHAYNSEPPFDRHDWYIRRPQENVLQRYVIDYYSAPNDDQGNPVFYLDARPAIDSPSALIERISEWSRKKRIYWQSIWQQPSIANRLRNLWAALSQSSESLNVLLFDLKTLHT